MTKTLIIATGRCGSSSLAYAIENTYDIKLYNEPFNNDLNYTNPSTGKREYLEELGLNHDFTKDWINVPLNTVWKCLLIDNHYPSEFQGEVVEFFTEFSKKFEKTILLTRRNHGERFYSNMYGMEYKSWDVPYHPKDITINENNLYMVNKFIEQNKNLEILSDVLNEEIYYYEDLFTDKESSQTTWDKMMGKTNDFDSIWLKWLDPRLRLRRPKSKP